MIDLLKYFVNERELFLQNIEESLKIDLKGRINFKTGQIMDYPKTAYYNNMFIEITENQASLKGSIHKHFNKLEGYGEQNFNDFSYCDFRNAISDLQSGLNIDLKKTRVTNLEFGLNIDVKEDPKDLIDNMILMYGFKPPNRNEKFYGKGDYLEFKKTDYSLKIYNKSKQNLLKNRKILRVELKVTGSRYLKRHFNIYTLDDLDRNRFKKLFNKLLEHFDKLLIVDSLSLKNRLRIDEIVLYQNGINPNYWKDLGSEKSSKVINRFKSDFNKLLENYCMLETKKQLKNLLKNKYKELMNCDCELLKNVA